MYKDTANEELIKEPSSLFLASISVFLATSIGIVFYLLSSFKLSYYFIILGIFIIGGILIVLTKPWFGFLLLVCSLPFRSFSLASIGPANIRISEAIFILVAVALILNALVKAKIKVQRSKIDLPLILFCGWMLLTLLWSSDLVAGIIQFTRVFFGILLFFLSIHIIKSYQRLHYAINTWIIVGFIVALFAIYEFLSSGLPYFAQHYMKASTVVFTKALRSSVFLSPTLLASYLNLCIFLAIGKLLNLKRDRQKVVMIGVIFILCCALLFTFSRGGWAGFLFGLIYMLYKSNTLKKTIVLILPILLIFILFWGGIIKEVTSARLISYVHPQEDPAFQERLILWHATTKEIILGNPVLGVGIGNSAEALDELSHYYPVKFQYIHNLYFNILAELGIIGLILFFWICTSIALAIFSFLKENPIEESRKLIWAFYAGLISYAVHGAVHFSLAERHIWVFLGIGMALIKGVRLEKKNQMESNRLS